MQRRVVDAFLAAARAGDFEGLLAVLDPDVVLRIDARRCRPLARPPVSARTTLPQILAARHAFAPLGRPALVNGVAGASSDRRAAARGRRVHDRRGPDREIDIIGDPAKLPGTTA